MKRKYYHGTSADNLPTILKHGLMSTENKIWNVSSDVVYLWCPEAVGKGNDIEEQEYKEQEAFRRASESAQFACATAKDCRLVVLEIELDSKEIEPDYSSENMKGQGAVCISRDIELHEIKKISISNDLSILKGYFINMASSNEFSALEFSRNELKIAEVFSHAEIYIEEVEDMIEWEQVKINRKKMASVK